MILPLSGNSKICLVILKEVRKYIYFSLTVLCGILLSGCMEGDENSATYYRYGIARSTPSPHLYTTNSQGISLLISSPMLEAFGEVQEGDCFEVEFKADPSLEGTNQIAEAEMLRLYPVNTWPVHPELTDTSTVDLTEPFIGITSFNRSQLIENYFFLIVDHKNYREGQIDTFDLSYNPDQHDEEETETGEEEEEEESPTTTNDSRVIYDLFLRVQKEEGRDTIAASWRQTNAFLIDSLVDGARNRHQMTERDTLFLRINYPRGYNSDSTLYLWSETALFPVLLSGFN